MPEQQRGRRVLFTGISGTGVGSSIEKLCNHLEKQGRNRPRHLRIEPIMCKEAKQGKLIEADAGTVRMLGLSRPVLRKLWKAAFAEAMKEANKAPATQDVFLSLHACYYHTRTRDFFTVVDEIILSEFKADLTINLIDDLYDIMDRLSAERGLYRRGVGLGKGALGSVKHFARLFQVLQWRSTETLLTDHLAEGAFGGKAQVKLLAVKHPLATAERLIYTPENTHFYLSHPISEPRRMQQDGRQEDATKLIQEVSQVADALRQEGVVFEPTTIDELRFESVESPDDPDRTKRVPVLLPRWPMPDARTILWVQPAVQRPNPLDIGGSFSSLLPDQMAEILFRREGDAETVQHLLTVSDLVDALFDEIKVRVSSRDHRLVEQAEHVVVYRPIFAGNASSGVRKEIEYHEQLVREGVRLSESRVFVLTWPDDLADYRKTFVVNYLATLKWQGAPRKKVQEDLERAISVFGAISDFASAKRCLEEVRKELAAKEILIGGMLNGALEDEPSFQDDRLSSAWAQRMYQISQQQEPPYVEFLGENDREFRELIGPLSFVEKIMSVVRK